MRRVLAIAIGLSFVVVCAAPATAGQTEGFSSTAPRVVALTFDDLPKALPPGESRNDLEGLRATTHELLSVLTKHRAPAIGFVNEKRLYVKDQLDARIAVLEMWLEEGMTLGNHSFAHARFQETPLSKYEDDAIRGDAQTTRFPATRLVNRKIPDPRRLACQREEKMSRGFKKGLVAFLVVGGLAGSYMIGMDGSRFYREYKTFADTPETPIGSLRKGWGEIRGRARPVVEGRLVTSPVTQTACLFYKVEIERHVQRQTGRRYSSSSTEGWDYVDTDAAGDKFYLEDGTGKVLVDARGAQYDLTRTGWHGAVESGVMIVTEPNGKKTYQELSGDPLGLYVWRVCKAEGCGSGGYRLIEFCILPGHEYLVVGTSMENPNPRDERDRKMIAAGAYGTKFLITWRNKQQQQELLRNRAAKPIFGSAGLAIASLALLLIINRIA